jgi:pyruvate formate lyase activating enzyme
MTAVRIPTPLPSDATTLDAPLGSAGRRAGAGLDGLRITDLERGERLAAMRDGRLGSVHSWELVTAVDGPGTRMTVFFSGCPLRCLYCQNPDMLAMHDGHPVLADDLLVRIARYVPVFRATGGGITLSGGEVLMQPAFAARILRGAKELDVHTALDTSGYLGAHATGAMLDDTDLVLLDIKAGRPETYRRLTGGELAPTLEFGERIARRGLSQRAPEIWIRFVLVPGWTADPDEVELIADHVAALEDIRPGTVSRVEVLPFHQMGRDKWAAIGRHYALGDVRPPMPELTERVREQFRARGLTVY